MIPTIILVLLGVLGAAFIVSRYRLCPPNQVLVVYGAASDKSKPAKCCHGGGTFVWPLLQNSAILSLRPFTVDIDLSEALSQNKIRVDVPSAFTVAISIEQEMLDVAAQRLLHMNEKDIIGQTKEIIIGQMRAVISSLTIEQINSDRDAFMASIRTHVVSEISKLGLCLINANIINITDESGIIKAVGQKAASEAVNQANIDVAKQNQLGAIGVAEANKVKEISVAERASETAIGTAEADKHMRIGTTEAAKETALAVAKQTSEQAEGESAARIKIATADQNAKTAEANAQTKILEAEKLSMTAKLTKDEVVREEIDKAKRVVKAEAQAAEVTTLANAKAAATKVNYEAEAAGQQKVLTAQAEGYAKLVEAAGGSAEAANAYLLVDKLPEIIATQVKALENIKIDNLTIWDSGKGGDGKDGIISNLAKDMIGSIPQVADLAKMVGIKLPGFLGGTELAASEAVIDVTAEAVTEPPITAKATIEKTPGVIQQLID